ncbi:MAG: ribosome silencing factor [Anaeroglobus sp.]|nr:ribosome silencing factor [Anaeroglobus sp.]
MIEQKNAYEVAVRAAADKKGATIEILDMSQTSLMADQFVIVTANNVKQAQAIADNVEENLKKEGFTVYHREGYTTGRWILLDAGETIVHIFVSDDREYYGLEQVWADVPRLQVAGE